MKKGSIVNYLFIGFLTIGLFGCKTTRKTVDIVENTGNKAQDELLEIMERDAFKYQTLSARINAVLRLSGSDVSSKGDIKVVKDSALQISFQPLFGIEVFRVEISKDSLKILDRLNKRYAAESYADLKGELSIDLNFSNLQALFTNRIFLPGVETISKREYNRFKLTSEDGQARLRAKGALDIAYLFNIDGEEKLLSSFITDKDEQYALQWKYMNFSLIDKQLFPMRMDVRITDKGVSKAGMTINFARIQTDIPVNMDFTIPAKYNRITFANIIKSLTKNK